jgi:hypothetical protein
VADVLAAWRRPERWPVEMRVDGNLPAGDWTPVGNVRRGTEVVRFVMSSTEPDGTIVLMTSGGVGDAPGEWTVTVDELVGPGDSRLQGPWVLRVGP